MEIVCEDLYLKYHKDERFYTFKSNKHHDLKKKQNFDFSKLEKEQQISKISNQPFDIFITPCFQFDEKMETAVWPEFKLCDPNFESGYDYDISQSQSTYHKYYLDFKDIDPIIWFREWTKVPITDFQITRNL